MDVHHFDLLARTVTPSRRTTLASMLAAASGFAGKNAAEARKKRKGPDCGKNAQLRCSSDAETCRAMIMSQCQGPPEGCLPLAACCDTCSANGMFTCLLKDQESMTAARIATRVKGDRDA